MLKRVCLRTDMEIKDNNLDSLESNVAVKRFSNCDDETLTEISKNETPKKKSKNLLKKLSPVMTLHQLEPNLKYEVSFHFFSNIIE